MVNVAVDLHWLGSRWFSARVSTHFIETRNSRFPTTFLGTLPSAGHLAASRIVTQVSSLDVWLGSAVHILINSLALMGEPLMILHKQEMI